MNVKDEDYQHRSAAAAESQQSATDFSMDNRRRRQLPSHENPSMQYNIITGKGGYYFRAKFILFVV